MTRFFILDHDCVTRQQVVEIILTERLGEIVGEGDKYLLLRERLAEVEILIIDPFSSNDYCPNIFRYVTSNIAPMIIVVSEKKCNSMTSIKYKSRVEYHIHKPICRGELITSIKKVQEKIFLKKRVIKLVRQQEINRLMSELTAAELRILSLINQGKSQQRIADELCISINTVKYHVRNILRKVKVEGGSKEAAKKVKQLGII